MQTHTLKTAIMFWLTETLLSYIFISAPQVAIDADSVQQKWAKTFW